MSESPKKPWFRFWAGDFLADGAIARLNLEQLGALILLWAYCWREGSIPADPADLCLYVRLGSEPDPKRIRMVSELVANFFRENPENPGHLISDRMDKERKDRDEHEKKASQAARTANKARWDKVKGAKASPDPKQIRNGSEMPPKSESESESESDNYSPSESAVGAVTPSTSPKLVPLVVKAPKDPKAKKPPKLALTGPNAEIPEEGARVQFFALVKCFPPSKVPNLTQAAKAFRELITVGQVSSEALVECGRRYVASMDKPQFLTSLHAWLAGHGHLAFLEGVLSGAPAPAPPGEKPKAGKVEGYEW